MKKLLLLSLLASFVSLPSLAGTNAAVTLNTNSQQLSNLGFSTSGKGLFWSNSQTGAWGQIPTNSHLHFTDEHGSTFDFLTNGTLIMSNSTGNTNWIVLSNGNINFDGIITGNGSGLTGVAGGSGIATTGGYATNLTIVSGNGAGLTNLNGVAFNNVLSNGVVGDGSTDDTANIQRLLNLGGSWYFPSNRYVTGELQITNNTWLAGPGTLVYKTGAAYTNIHVRCGLNTNISITGLCFDGQDYTNYFNRPFYAGGYAQGGSPAVTYPQPNIPGLGQIVYWDAMGYRHGLQINADAGGVISGLTISGYGGAAIIPCSIHGGTDGLYKYRTVVTGDCCFSNFVGLYCSATQCAASGPQPSWITNYVPGGTNAEYMTFSAMNLNNNTIGFIKGAGNCIIQNSMANDNYVGEAYSFDNLNPNHGLVDNVTFNHEVICLIFAYGDTAWGDDYRNCHFLGYSANNNGTGYNIPIVLNDCEGFDFEGCKFGYFAFTNASTPSGGTNFFEHNTYGQGATWATENISTDGKLLIAFNRSWQEGGDNDGQPATLIENGGNGSGLTNFTYSAVTTPLLAGTNTWTGTNLFNTNVNIGGTNSVSALVVTNNVTVTGNVTGATMNATTFAGTFVGNAQFLTNLQSTNLAALLAAPNTWAGTNTFTNAVIATNDPAGNQFAGLHIGNGASLTNLNASSIASGTLSSNYMQAVFSNIAVHLAGTPTLSLSSSVNSAVTIPGGSGILRLPGTCDLYGSCVITNGTSTGTNTAGTVFFTNTFATPFTTAPVVQFQQITNTSGTLNAANAHFSGWVVTYSSTTSNFQCLQTGASTAMVSGATYGISWIVEGQ